MRLLQLVLSAVAVAGSLVGQTYTIKTFAGGGLPGNIPGTSASLVDVNGVAIDRVGNVFFSLGDGGYQTVLRLDASTSILTRVAGTGTPGFSGDNGPATAAQLNYVTGVALDSAGNLYIAEYCRIRKVANGVITTVAGNGTTGFSGDNGPATSAQIGSPNSMSSVALDGAGNLFIADYSNSRIRKIANGVITTVAGNGTPGFSGDNGPATSAQLNAPTSVAVDSSGNLYIADTSNNRIRKVSNGVITTVAGNGTQGFGGDNGPATGAQLNYPESLSVDSSGNLYIAGQSDERIRKVANGVITTIAGNGTIGFSGDGGPAIDAQLDTPNAIGVDAVGNVYIADVGNERIRKVSNGIITTIAGGGSLVGDNGPGASAQLYAPYGLAVAPSNDLYIADSRNNRIRKVSNGTITTVAGSGTADATGFSGDNGPATSAQLSVPADVAVDAGGNIYIMDTANGRVRMVANGVITTVAGNGNPGFSGDNGPATSARLGVGGSYGVAVDSNGSLYIADTGNNRVRKVSSGAITTVAGNGTPGYSGDNGPATGAALHFPYSVAVDASGSLYIADGGNSRIRKVTDGVITTVAGTGTPGYSGDNGPATAARLSQPVGVAVDAQGNLYIADSGGPSFIRKVTNGVITTIAGNGSPGFSGDNGPAANSSFNSAIGIAVDSAGNVYVSDSLNDRVRVLQPTVQAPPLAITTVSPLTPGGVGVAYSQILLATGGQPPYSWSVTAGTLPGGLALSAAGAITGTPATPGLFNFTVQVKDSASGNASAPLALTINAPTPSISSLSPNSAAAGGPTFTLIVSGSGYLTGSTVQWNGSSLSTNYVSGTQLTASVQASQIASQGTASVTVVNPGGTTSNVATFTINPPTVGPISIITASPLPAGAVGVPYSQTLAATGGVTPYTGWAISAGNLPPGISLSNIGSFLTGLLNGVPTTPGTFSFSVQVTDGANTVATKQFSLTITGGTVSISAAGVVNAASYAGGAVSPGEIITIFGSGMGPSTLVGLQLDSRGYVSTSLAGTQVLFDGVAAPLIYTLAGQVSAVVPYAVSGKTSTQLQVTYQAEDSNLVTIPVTTVVPGIFTIDASGKGPGAIVNQDGTVNSAANPAAAGSYVFVYATGEGQTTPGGIDGKPGDAPAPTPIAQPVTATMGGVGAQVQYAGGVPGLVAGVLQVNVLVPQGVATGNSVPILLNVGGQSTQTSVTLSIR